MAPMPPTESWYDQGGILPGPLLTDAQHQYLAYGLTLGNREYPPKATVYWQETEDDLELVWHWRVSHIEGSGGVRSQVTTRWGSCTRWEDAMEIALAMVAKEQAGFWGRVIATVATDGLRRS